MKKNKTGFTLIEIMIVVSIIGMVSAVAIPSFRKFNDEQVLKNATAQMTQTLRKVQNNAQSRVKCRDGNPSSGWEVVLGDLSGKSFYQIVQFCQNTLDNYSPYTLEEEVTNLPAGIYINQVDDSASSPPLISPRYTNPGMPDCVPNPPFPDSTIVIHFNNSDDFANFSPLCLGIDQAQILKFMLRSPSSVTATITVDRGGSIESSFK